VYSKARLLGAALIAALLLALGAGSAAASRTFSVVGGGRAFLLISQGRVTFTGDNGANWISEVTLHGTIHPSLPKTAGALQGAITSVRDGGCRSSVGIECQFIGLTTRPWHITLSGFSGTLPRITALLSIMRSVELGWTIERSLRCLYIGEISVQLRSLTEGTLERFDVLAGGASTIPLIRAEGEEFFRRCPRTLKWESLNFRIEPMITIRLA